MENWYIVSHPQVKQVSVLLFSYLAEPVFAAFDSNSQIVLFGLKVHFQQN